MPKFQLNTKFSDGWEDSAPQQWLQEALLLLRRGGNDVVVDLKDAEVQWRIKPRDRTLEANIATVIHARLHARGCSGQLDSGSREAAKAVYDLLEEKELL